MKWLLGFLGSLFCLGVAWLLWSFRRAGTFFSRTDGLSARKSPTIHEANRLEESKRRIEDHRRSREEEIKCEADAARKRIADKFGKR